MQPSFLSNKRVKFMHELSITQSIVDTAIEYAKKENASKVLSLKVEIGALSGVVADAVEFCYESVTQGTLLDGTLLVIDWIEAKGKCPECGHEQVIENYFGICDECGALALEVMCGEELRIKELEVE